MSATKPASTSSVQLLDARGNPIAREATDSKSVRRAAPLTRAIANSRRGVDFRAADPTEFHGWAAAVSQTIARAVTKAPLMIYREDEATITSRRAIAKAADRPFTFGYGDRRTRSKHYIQHGDRLKGIKVKGLMEDLDHPVSRVLMNPHPNLDTMQLIEATVLWLLAQGEATWCCLNESNQFVMPMDTEQIAYILPIPPDCLEPVTAREKLLGYRISTTPEGSGVPAGITLSPEYLVRFRFYNRREPTRGAAPLRGGIRSILLDLMAQDHNSALLNNNAEPSGFLTNDDEMVDEVEAEKALEQFTKRYAGSDNARKVTALWGGWKFDSKSYNPKDMDFRGMQNDNRDLIIALLSATKSSLSITEKINYATAQVQEQALYDRGVMPLWKLIEGVIDRTFLLDEPDSVVALFDTSKIEALQAGLATKAQTANVLAGRNVRMPPSLALQIAGIDTEAFPGDQDPSFVGAGLVDDNGDPIDEPAAADPVAPNDTPPTDKPATEDKPAATPATEDQPTDITDEEQLRRMRMPRLRAGDAPWVVTSKSTEVKRSRSSWMKLTERLHRPIEKQLIEPYRKWIDRLEHNVLSAMSGSSELRKAAKVTHIDAVLFNEEEAASLLGGAVRPVMMNSLSAVSDYVEEETDGSMLFDLGDARVKAFVDKRVKVLTGSAPKTVQTAMRTSLVEGITLGESIEDLRARVKAVGRVYRSPSRSLLVARTESSGFINGARDVIFDQNQIETEEWLTASDEVVRDSHVVYGNAGPQKRGFNYLDLSGNEGGVLRYPVDVDCTNGSEVCSCRCSKVPVS